MDFRDTPPEAEFRANLRSWLSANLDADQRQASNRLIESAEIEAARQWSAALFEAGYAGITWPTEYGGRGLSPSYQAIYYDEMTAAGAPPHLGLISLNMAGPTIIAWGTQEQKARLIKPMLNAEEVWCQGFSEPGSGSDLAAARTRAVLDGDNWVVNGQKVWSSHAHLADWCILLVRTDPDAPKHRGLSYLLVDMHSPGVEVRPLRQLTGDPEFNEIFFTDVRVPKDSILGKPGEGWNVALTTLMHERGTLGFYMAAELQTNLARLVQAAQQTAPDGSVPAKDPVVRDAIARQWAAFQGLRFSNYRSLTRLLETGEPGPESSISKIVWADTNQLVTKLAIQLQGMSGGLDGGRWQYEQLRSRGNSIEGGTSEIMRNIVAERVLNLPHSR